MPTLKYCVTCTTVAVCVQATVCAEQQGEGWRRGLRGGGRDDVTLPVMPTPKYRVTCTTVAVCVCAGHGVCRAAGGGALWRGLSGQRGRARAGDGGHPDALGHAGSLRVARAAFSASLAGAAFQGKTGRTSSSAFQDCSQTPSLVVIHEFDCLQQVLFGAPGSGNWIFQETATALGQRFYQRILCNGVSISRNNNGVFREMVTGCIRKMTAFGQQLNLDVLCSGMGVFKKRWQPCVNSFTWVFCAMVWVFSGNGDGLGQQFHLSVLCSAVGIFRKRWRPRSTDLPGCSVQCCGCFQETVTA